MSKEVVETIVEKTIGEEVQDLCVKKGVEEFVFSTGKDTVWKLAKDSKNTIVKKLVDLLATEMVIKL